LAFKIWPNCWTSIRYQYRGGSKQLRYHDPRLVFRSNCFKSFKMVPFVTPGSLFAPFLLILFLIYLFVYLRACCSQSCIYFCCFMSPYLFLSLSILLSVSYSLYLFLWLLSSGSLLPFSLSFLFILLFFPFVCSLCCFGYLSICASAVNNLFCQLIFCFFASYLFLCLGFDFFSDGGVLCAFVSVLIFVSVPVFTLFIHRLLSFQALQLFQLLCVSPNMFLGLCIIFSLSGVLLFSFGVNLCLHVSSCVYSSTLLCSRYSVFVSTTSICLLHRLHS